MLILILILSNFINLIRAGSLVHFSYTPNLKYLQFADVFYMNCYKLICVQLAFTAATILLM